MFTMAASISPHSWGAMVATASYLRNPPELPRPGPWTHPPLTVVQGGGRAEESGVMKRAGTTKMGRTARKQPPGEAARRGVANHLR